MHRWLIFGLALLGGAGGLVHAADWPLTGELNAHDPSLLKEGNTWWCFTTGAGLKTKSSSDGLSWRQGAPLFTAELPWWRNYAPAMRPLDIWAPDLQEFGGRIWCYYSVSEFGRNNSAIGLKSCSNLAAGDWRDDGLVIGSKAGVQAYNAIDPNLTIDSAGRPWLVFGSWFDGIQLVKLDPQTMKPSGKIRCIARRENGIEGANVIWAHGFYFLFVSIDKCCVGIKSTYKIACGRSKEITGPYVARDGAALLNGNVTVIETGGERWKGPGGQDVYENAGSWVIARHAYDVENNGKPALRIADLYWDAENWPCFSPPVKATTP
jgi:arabinan endo-1,5-alpha-L-arabinosidase